MAFVIACTNQAVVVKLCSMIASPSRAVVSEIAPM